MSDVESLSKEVSLSLYHNTKYSSFEHSLVKELGYTGFQKLRIAFDKAFGGEEKVPKFDLVVDAGCGTGLVGEQVRLSFSPSSSTVPLVHLEMLTVPILTICKVSQR